MVKLCFGFVSCFKFATLGKFLRFLQDISTLPQLIKAAAEISR